MPGVQSSVRDRQARQDEGRRLGTLRLLMETAWAQRTSDCTTSLHRIPTGSGVLAKGIDNGSQEAGSAFSLVTKTYTGISQSFINGPIGDSMVDFRMAVWDPRTRLLLATTANLATTINALPEASENQQSRLVTAALITPIDLQAGQRVLLGQCVYGTSGVKDIRYSAESCQKAIMQIPCADGGPFALRTPMDSETGGVGGLPIGGYQGGTPTQIGTATPGNFPWTDLLDADQLAARQGWDTDYTS